MRVLDLFCGGGGVSDGIARTGATVIGCDVQDAHVLGYPYTFVHRDALTLPVEYLRSFDLIWASPPCQFATAYRRGGRVKESTNLIGPTRELLIASGRPYIIENVESARPHLRDSIMLCGSLFGLTVQRHRLFECSFPMLQPPCRHYGEPRYPGSTTRAPNSRRTVEIGAYRIPLPVQLRAMGVTRHVSKHVLSQMIPPSYSEWLVKGYMAHAASNM